jgi:hypothetical protein
MGYNRPDMVVKVGLKGQKGYTMQDIGALDKRITALEYYTVLNALSLTSQQLSITNANTGLERFKNGIFADPFTDSSLMRTDDTELNIAVSPKNSIARPNIFQLLNEFELDTTDSTGIQATGKLLTLDYTSELLDGNPFATEYRNCTESYWNFSGTGYLFPDFYMGVDNENAAPQTITVDQSVPLQSAISAGGFTNIDTIQGNPVLVSSTKNGSTVTNYYSAAQTQTITDLSISSTSTTTYTNDNIVSVASLPYMSARTLAFVATGLKPNTRVFPFFDKLSVVEFCAPATLNSAYATSGRFDLSKTTNLSASANATDILTQNGNVGDPISTNENGEVYLIFYLQGNTFRTGERVFTVCDSIYLNVSSSITTEASATYTSSTLATTSQTTTYNIVQPQFTPVVTTKNLSPITWTTTSYNPPVNNGGTVSNPISVPNLGGNGQGGSSHNVTPTINYCPPADIQPISSFSDFENNLGLPPSVPLPPVRDDSVPLPPVRDDTVTYTGADGDNQTSTNNSTNNDGSGGGGGGGGDGSASSDCLAPWTLISMFDGSYKKVKDIVIGDRVKSMYGFNTVTKIATPVVTTRLVAINDSDDYFATETHPFMTNNGWGTFNVESLKNGKPVEYSKILEDNNGKDLVEINIDSKLAKIANNQIEYLNVDKLKFKEVSNFTVYRLSVDGDHTYVSNDLVSHNKD